LFDASETVRSVLRYDDSRRAGGVIASDGTDVFLYPADDLVRAAVESGGALRLRKLECTQLHFHAFTGDASDLGLPEGMTVASLLITPDGQRFGFTFEDRPGNMRVVVTKKWVCSPHGETYVRLTGGQCPEHEDGTLMEV
jgi:hypothetical protein